MSNEEFTSHSSLSRRSLVKLAALLSVPFFAKATKAWAQDKLAGSGEVVIASYGGSFTDGVREYVYDPFTKATGVKVVDAISDFHDPQIKAMHRAGRIDWDLACPLQSNYPEMHEAGMFEPIDYKLWDQEAIEGVPQNARPVDAVVMFRSGSVLAYDERAFPNGAPRNWEDFWDVQKFPGQRGLFGGIGYHTMIFALLADGVEHKDIWPLTDNKIDRAFKKLNEIKPHITKWWTAGGEPVQLLINRELALSNAPDGRMVAAIRRGARLRMIWNGGLVGNVPMTILKGGPNTANAQKFIAFLNRAQIAAGFTQGTGSPAPNLNQLKHLPAELISLLSISPENASMTVAVDYDWLSAKRPDGKTNADHVQERWLAWKVG
ncbi:spermidine/putrescine-binding protein [Bradyrhizobium sp. JR4.1]|uniref:ABC transporter substrate-binding protein n=1 Tax=Bradyrhizobium sp. JR4.1 TaxID=3156372 RepID=UPI0033977158